MTGDLDRTFEEAIKQRDTWRDLYYQLRHQLEGEPAKIRERERDTKIRVLMGFFAGVASGTLLAWAWWA